MELASQNAPQSHNLQIQGTPLDHYSKGNGTCYCARVHRNRQALCAKNSSRAHQHHPASQSKQFREYRPPSQQRFGKLEVVPYCREEVIDTFQKTRNPTRKDRPQSQPLFEQKYSEPCSSEAER